VPGAVFQHAATAIAADLLGRTGGGGFETAAGFGENILDLTGRSYEVKN
jgi:hypothetical protein